MTFTTWFEVAPEAASTASRFLSADAPVRADPPTITPDFGSRPRIADRNRKPPALTPGTIPSIRPGASGDCGIDWRSNLLTVRPLAIFRRSIRGRHRKPRFS